MAAPIGQLRAGQSRVAGIVSQRATDAAYAAADILSGKTTAKAALRAVAASTGDARSGGSAVAKKPDSKQLDALLKALSDVGSISEIQVGGIDGKNLAKLDNLINSGRDFTDTGGEMQGTIRRFLKALFDEKIPTQKEIDACIEDAVIAVIALRLRTGGGDVKSSFKPLSPEYAKYKRKKYPNSKGIGWATGELAHDWAEYGNVRVIR